MNLTSCFVPTKYKFFFCEFSYMFFIIIQQDVEHENVKQMNDVLADLYKKHDEYDDLIRRCKKTKESYEELNSEMAQMMNNYKKDMGRLERKIRFV